MLRLLPVVLLLTACALRPRYTELVGRLAPAPGSSDVALRVVDKSEGTPVGGARVEIGERTRFRAVTDEQGVFRLPLDRKYADENARWW